MSVIPATQLVLCCSLGIISHYIWFVQHIDTIRPVGDIFPLKHAPGFASRYRFGEKHPSASSTPKTFAPNPFHLPLQHNTNCVAGMVKSIKKIDKMEDKRINICLSCDNNYAKYAGVVIASILKNAAAEDKLCFYLLDGGISDKNKAEINSLKSLKKCEIEFVHIDNDLFVDYTNVKTHSYLSIAAYYRLKLGSLLPYVNKIIYLDCDVIVNDSLACLFNTDLGEYIIAGVSDIKKKKVKENPQYINSGVLLIDLEKIRKENVERDFFEYTLNNINTITNGDQEIINEVLKGRVKLLPAEWNVQSSNFTNRSNFTKNPKIIHFVAKRKPWHYASFSPHKDYYFRYLQCTPWKLSEEEYRHWTVDNQKDSIIEYLKYRPLFFLRPKFYKALYYSYFKSFFEIKTPVIKSNTFLLWEPCSKSHAEVLPGFAKYLLDLGYHVSVLAEPKRFKEGLFSRFDIENISYNNMSQREIRKYFRKSDLSDVKGVLVTTAGKIRKEKYGKSYEIFSDNADFRKIFFVEHEAQHACDKNLWEEDFITLRKLDYKNAKSIVVNPHYFGNINITPKNENKINFITIGAIRAGKKNCNTIINAVKTLAEYGITNFKITVIGKGSLKNIPDSLKKYFDIKGHLDFKDMYTELEKADFLLTSYEPENPAHIRYRTSGTSGNFQLVYGFCKPCIITESFGPINGFDETNSILYSTPDEFAEAMKKAILLPQDKYLSMQESLKKYSSDLYESSKNNLYKLILSQSGGNNE